MIIYKESESTYFQYQKLIQNALALVLSAAQLKEEDSYEAERGHSGICVSAVAVCTKGGTTGSKIHVTRMQL